MDILINSIVIGCFVMGASFLLALYEVDKEEKEELRKLKQFRDQLKVGRL